MINLAFELQPVATDAADPDRRLLRDRLIETLNNADPLVAVHLGWCAEVD
jgi:hypothetical protein